jgi:phosphoribosyl 1,2-cyclic phosphate phosphodiesterase
MKLRMLGCGTSSGVPRIGSDWGTCDPAEPKNRRTRASIMVETANTRVLIDTGPDLREQLLTANVAHLDAVIWTHDHADHCHGIDDLRQVFHHRGSPVPGYSRPATAAALEARFAYVFQGRAGYPPTAMLTVLDSPTTIGDLRISPVDQPHGGIMSTGLRFDDDAGKSIGYATDCNILTDDMRRMYQDLDLWVVDALRRAPHPSHPTLDEALGWIAELAPARAVLTHMDQSMDYASLVAMLPNGVEPGYDGLEIAL